MYKFPKEITRDGGSSYELLKYIVNASRMLRNHINKLIWPSLTNRNSLGIAETRGRYTQYN